MFLAEWPFCKGIFEHFVLSMPQVFEQSIFLFISRMIPCHFSRDHCKYLASSVRLARKKEEEESQETQQQEKERKGGGVNDVI